MSILIGNTYYTNISPVMTGISSPSPYVAECSIVCISQFYKALDGNIDSYFRTNIQTVTPFTISLDYGEGNEKVVEAYRLDCHYNVSFTMKSWNFEGSNDNNTWDVLDSRSNISWSENAIQDFTFDNSTKYRYYRFNILEKNSTNSVCINEIELLQEDSTSNLEFRKVKKSNLPNSKTDGVDAVYFTENGEMYITDKNGNLKQSCGTKISTDSNNAIKTKTDGLFVQDLSDKINQINFAQKTVNEGLDYCYCTLGDAISGQTYSINDTFPFTMSKSNNMTCNNSNHSIILKKGKTYRISSDIQCNLTSASIIISIYNLTKGMNLTSFHKTVNNTASESAGTAIYTPDLDDEEIIVKIISLTGTVKGTSKPTDFGYFIAEEIGRAITIDPLEYVNSESGIEDTPIGEIIRTIGNKTPKHYLMCDGSTHNIADYPHLAQYFKDTFGAINVFGGDGTTTFGVPDYTTEKKLDTQYMAPNAWASSIYSSNYAASKAFNGEINVQSNYWQTVEPVTLPVEIGIDLGSEYYITRYALHNYGWGTASINDRPNTWDFEGSNDKTNWNTIDTVTNYTWTSSTPEFKVSMPGSYRYYRWVIKTCVGTGVSGVPPIAPILNQILLYYSNSNFTHIKAEPTYFMELNQAAYINQYCDTYSTDEKIIGKWVDGKPLYRKSYEVTSPSALNSSTVLFIYSSDMEIQDIDGCILGPDENIPVNFYYATNNYVSCWSNHKNKQIKMVAGNSAYTSRPAIITILYTKTIDAPNSFDYGMVIDQFAQQALLDVAVTDAEVDKCFE